MVHPDWASLELTCWGTAWHRLLGAPYRPFPLPGDKPHYAPDRVCDIRHIALELSFDLEARQLFGVASTTLSPINEGLTAVTFDCVELEVKGVRLAGGDPLPYSHSGGKLRVELGQPRQSGEELTIVVEYEGSPRRGLYFTAPDAAYPQRPVQIWTQGEDEDNRHWFPCYDFPNERATSEMRVTVPERFFALSNGRLVGVRHDAERKTKTYHWRQEVPHVSYLISLVVGEYVEIADACDGLTVLYYVPPGREADAPRSFANTPDMLRFFSQRIGIPYPYAKYAQIVVADFIFGGMENTSATTLTDLTLHDERAHLDYSSDPLLAHELAHQWFGDLLTCKDWSHAWLNEGFATYFDALYQEHHLGVDEFRYTIYQHAETYFQEDREHYRRPIVCNVYHQPIDLFDRHLYQKGALVLHMLRYLLGEELFWKAIRHYARQHQGQSVVTGDLQRAIEEATGRNLDWFFDQWVYKGGYPELQVQYQWDEEHKLARLTVSQKQSVDDLTPLFRLPLEVAFTADGSSQSLRIEVNEREQSFHFPLAVKPLMVQVDPGNWIPKTVELSLPKELLLHQLQHDEDVMGRIRAAHALAKQGTPEAVESLKRVILTDPFWGVGAEAAKALSTIRSSAARDALLQGLGVSHPKARRGVVAALGEYRDEEAASALARVLEQDESYSVAAAAALALGKTRSPRAFEALQGALERESHNEVIRSQAFEGLRELREERAIPLALEWTVYGKPPQAREGAVRALGKLGENSKKPGVVDRLSELLEDPWLRVRLRAVEALEELKEPRAIPALERLAERDLDGRVQRRAREAAARIREGRDRPEELKRLQEDLDRLREENRQLRDRLDRLEARLPPDSPR